MAAERARVEVLAPGHGASRTIKMYLSAAAPACPFCPHPEVKAWRLLVALETTADDGAVGDEQQKG